MGIPRFYRWISERYPQINQLISDVSLLPEFDNLYLDMNGIIHNCTHGDDSSAPSLTEAQQFVQMAHYLDQIISQIVKPKTLVYFAIDGVAPRAKLNQQRSRRFRAGLELSQSRAEKALQKEVIIKKGDKVDDDCDDLFDSNCITPGTTFMARLSKYLLYFLRLKMKTDPHWQKLTLFFSGHEVPGEGEHKIMEFIRRMKSQDGYPSNIRHCMYGSDADLMLLGLATHEPHFTLLREVVDWNMNNKGTARDNVTVQSTKELEWQMVHLSLFREYLDMELRVEEDFYDTERALDDFVLLTFLLGNDFIPHSPTLEIGEDAIARLLSTYRSLLPEWGGYLTKGGKLDDPKRLIQLCTRIGEMEEDILTDRVAEEKKKKKFGRDRRPEKDVVEAVEEVIEERVQLQVGQRGIVLEGSEAFQETKLTYYRKKFGIQVDQPELLEAVRRAYCEALLWCIAYYYQGPPSWKWFYPFHYSPMISDLPGSNMIDVLNSITFDAGTPILPFQQLLSCLPPASASLLPAPYRFLMNASTSPIVSYYPLDFEVDMEGKRNAWEGVNLLPFIDARKLKEAVEKFAPQSQLTSEEQGRNTLQEFPLMLQHDASMQSNISSPFPTLFPDIVHCESKLLQFKVPDYPTGAFLPVLQSGVHVPLAGFPSFRTLPEKNTGVSCEKINLNCFGRATRRETLVVSVPSPRAPDEDDFIPLAKNLLSDPVVFVNWPHLQVAKIIGVSSRHGIVRDDDSDFTSFSNSDAQVWDQKSTGEARAYLEGRGIPGTGGLKFYTGGSDPLPMLIHVLLLQGVAEDPKSGKVKHVFGSAEHVFPAHTILPYVASKGQMNWGIQDPRFLESAPEPIEKRFPKEIAVVILDEKLKKVFGQVATVVGTEGGKVRVLVTQKKMEPNFGAVLASQMVDKYAPAYVWCKKISVSTNIWGRMAGSVVVAVHGETAKALGHTKLNLGLNLKLKKEFKMLGYSQVPMKNSTTPAQRNIWQQKDAVKVLAQAEAAALGTTSSEDEAGGWEYTERTLHIMAAYKRHFPEVFASIQAMDYSPTISAAALLPGMEESERIVKLQAMLLWLGQLETESMSLVPLTSQSLSNDAIAAVQQAQDSLPGNDDASSESILCVPAQLSANVARGNHQIRQIANNKSTIPTLGARVLSVTALGVPFGLKGSVVALHPHSGCVEVVFDSAFVSGTTLNDRCAKNRGKLIAYASLLLLSPGASVISKKSAGPNSATGGHYRQMQQDAMKPGGFNKPSISIKSRPKEEKPKSIEQKDDKPKANERKKAGNGIKSEPKRPVIKPDSKSPVIKTDPRPPAIKQDSKSPVTKTDPKSPAIKVDPKPSVIKSDKPKVLVPSPTSTSNGKSASEEDQTNFHHLLTKAFTAPKPEQKASPKPPAQKASPTSYAHAAGGSKSPTRAPMPAPTKILTRPKPKPTVTCPAGLMVPGNVMLRQKANDKEKATDKDKTS